MDGTNFLSTDTLCNPTDRVPDYDPSIKILGHRSIEGPERKNILD